MKKVIMAEFSDVRHDARVVKQAKALSKSDSLVELLMYNQSLERTRVNRKGNLTYIEFTFQERFKSSSHTLAFGRMLKAFVIFLNISKYIITHKADVYYAHNLYFLWAAAIASKIRHKLLVYDAHELHCEHYASTSFASTVRNKLTEIYERFLINYCDLCIQASDERADYISKRYRIDRPLVLNNYTPRFELAKNDRRRRYYTFLPESQRIMFYSGGIYRSQSRRIDQCIKALTYMEEVSFVIVGFVNDDIKNYLLQLAERYSVSARVHFLPACNFAKVVKYASSADLGVIPLYGETMNNRYSALNKVSEYLMAGLPIATSDYPNLENIIFRNPVGQVGITFNVKSAESIASSVMKLLCHPNYDDIRRNAHRVALNFMNWESEEKKLIDVYHKLFRI